MQTTAIEKTKLYAKPCSRLIDLGNGVMFPVNSEKEASFVEWMIGGLFTKKAGQTGFKCLDILTLRCFSLFCWMKTGKMKPFTFGKAIP